MTRLQNWRHGLSGWLASVARTPFQPGVHDCAMFAAGAVEVMTGVDPAANFRGRYRTIAGGLRILRREGYEDQIAFARAHFPATVTPRPGDLAAIRTPDGLALGVVQGLQIYAPGPSGLRLEPLSAAVEFFEV